MSWETVAEWYVPRTFRHYRIQHKGIAGNVRSKVRLQTRLPSADNDSDEYKYTTEETWLADHSSIKGKLDSGDDDE